MDMDTRATLILLYLNHKYNERMKKMYTRHVHCVYRIYRDIHTENFHHKEKKKS